MERNGIQVKMDTKVYIITIMGTIRIFNKINLQP